MPAVVRNRRAEIVGSESNRTQLPLAESLGRRQVEVDEVRVASIVGERHRKRALEPVRIVGDLVELDAPDNVRGQVPVVAGVAQREPLIERG